MVTAFTAELGCGIMSVLLVLSDHLLPCDKPNKTKCFAHVGKEDTRTLCPEIKFDPRA